MAGTLDIVTRPQDFYVDTTSGSDTNDGRSMSSAFATVQAAIDAVTGFDDIFIAPGEYDEAVTVNKAQVSLVGLGGRGAVFIAPSATNATGVTITKDDVTLDNIGCDGDGTGYGLLNYGRRTRAYRSKIEGGTDGLRLTLGTVAQIAAGTHGKGDDVWFVDCEFAWNTNGVTFVGTDYGAVTEAHIRDCTFHDNTAADMEEAHGAGGAITLHYWGLDVGDCTFLRQQDGTEPTKYLSLNDDNTNAGVVHGCTFPTALTSGKNLVSTSLLWVANYHPAGLSTGQPS